MYQIICQIVGIVPMLMHRFPRSDEKVKKDKKAIIAGFAYKDKKGLYVPSDCLRMMLIGNTKRRGACAILGSDIESGNGTTYKSFCDACIWVVGDKKQPEKVYFIPNKKTWDRLDVRSYMSKAGTRNEISRPCIDAGWKLEFTIQVTDEKFPSGKVKELFEVAGMRCGVLAYGPRFGRFVIKKWEVQE